MSANKIRLLQLVTMTWIAAFAGGCVVGSDGDNDEREGSAGNDAPALRPIYRPLRHLYHIACLALRKRGIY